MDDGRIRNKKVVFSVIVFIVYVWTMAVAVTKKFRFQMKTDTCGQGLRAIFLLGLPQAEVELENTGEQRNRVRSARRGAQSAGPSLEVRAKRSTRGELDFSCLQEIESSDITLARSFLLVFRSSYFNRFVVERQK